MGFNRSHYITNLYDGYINIHFEPLLPTDRELLYKVLSLVREVLDRGEFVRRFLFGHALFKWTGYILPEDVSEDSLRCIEEIDDVSIAHVYTLKYSILMLKEICRSDYTFKYSTRLEQLREDIETLWGKNTQQTDKICGSLQGLGLYETDLSPVEQDIFISADVVRKFKERCTDLGIPIYF